MCREFDKLVDYWNNFLSGYSWTRNARHPCYALGESVPRSHRIVRRSYKILGQNYCNRFSDSFSLQLLY